MTLTYGRFGVPRLNNKFLKQIKELKNESLETEPKTKKLLFFQPDQYPKRKNNGVLD